MRRMALKEKMCAGETLLECVVICTFIGTNESYGRESYAKELLCLVNFWFCLTVIELGA